MANMKYDHWNGRAFEIHRKLLEADGFKITIDADGSEWGIELPPGYTMKDVQRSWDKAVEMAKSEGASPQPSPTAPDTSAAPEEIPSGPGTRR